MQDCLDGVAEGFVEDLRVLSEMRGHQVWVVEPGQSRVVHDQQQCFYGGDDVVPHVVSVVRGVVKLCL